ncbi:MAG: hypothetical protein OEX11_00625 [Nitrosomonas sp.]|nr:hypothetical protein [Nitrosomonas sp.]
MKSIKKFQVLSLIFIIVLVLTASNSFGQPHRNFPIDSKFGKLTDFSFPELTISGQTLFMGAGGQIRGTDNLIIFPNMLNKTGSIRYQQDASGYVHRIWFLTPEEIFTAKEEEKASKVD